jgi:hypothetical protein
MNPVLFVLLFLWELPQNIIGVIVFLASRAVPNRTMTDRDNVIVSLFKKYPGMSLGRFIFVMAEPEKNYRYEYRGHRRDHGDLIAHEKGHSIQSCILGPFYFLILVFSGLWFVFTAVGEVVLGRRFIDYYAFFTEAWADRLGRAGRWRRKPASTEDAIRPHREMPGYGTADVIDRR